MKLLSAFLISLLFTSQALVAQVKSFKHFGIDKNIFPSRIECIDQVPTGELLVGTLGGLVVYDGRSFEHLTVTEGLIENAIASIEVVGDEVWLGHWTGNITKLNFSTKTTEVFNLQSELNFSSITSLKVNKDVVWLTTSNGKVFKKQGEVLEQIAFNRPIHSLSSMGDTLLALGDETVFIRTFSEDNNEWSKLVTVENVVFKTCNTYHNQLILGTDQGLWVLENNSINPLLTTESPVLAATKTTDALWFATEKNGLIQLKPDDQSLVFIDRENGLSYNQVKDVFVDRENILWAGTLAGLDQYLGASFELTRLSSQATDNLVWDVFLDDQELLVATSQGVYRQKQGAKKAERYFGSQKSWQKLQKQSNGTIWLIDEDGVLWRKTENQVVVFEKLSASANCMELVENQLWVGTDNGVFVIDQNGTIQEQLTTDNGLGGNLINGIYQNPINNEVWITSLGGDLTVLSDDSFKKYNQSTGLTSRVIQDVDFDANGKAWLASYDQGVFVLENDAFTSITKKDGLTSNSIFALSIDNEGSVWLGHNWGIDRYRPKYGDFEFFGKDAGFMGIEVNPGAMEIDQNGNVLVGTLTGLLKFNPKAFQPNMVEPTLKIVSATLGSTQITSREEVESQESDFRVVFNAVSLMNPSENTIKYRLSGIHQNFRTAINNTTIEYFSLPPGYYTFEIMACNNHGQCNDQINAINFIVAPPFYRTWWFYTLLFLLAILIIYSMDRYRAVSLIEEKNKLSEKLESSKQTIIELEQEVSDVRANLHQDSKILSGLMPNKGALAASFSRVFADLAFDGVQRETHSSVQFIKIQVASEVELFCMIDLIIPGQSAVYLAQRIRADFAVNSLKRAFNEAADVVDEFKKTVDQIVGSIHNHSGVSWLLCLTFKNKKFYHQNKVSIFFKDVEQVLELKAVPFSEKERIESHHLFEYDQSKQMVALNAATFELMSKDGSATLQPQVIMATLNHCIDQEKESIIEQVKNTILDFKGDLELQQDIMIITWRNE